MIPLISPGVSLAESRPSSRPRLADLCEQVARLSPDLDPQSTTFQTAVLLLAAAAIGQNVDRIARFLRCPRDFVARRARRLVDNGVWKRGRSVTLWNDPAEATFAFWSDVGVAEGKLCRRLDESGRPEWACAGDWWKSFDFVQPQSEPGVELRYRPRCRVVPAAELTLVASEPEPEPEPEPPTRPRATEAWKRPAAPRVEPQWMGIPPTQRTPVAYLGAPELFGGVVWLA